MTLTRRTVTQRVLGATLTPTGWPRPSPHYVRTIVSGNSPYDRFKTGAKNALSASAQRGLILFEGKAACVRCHAGFNFSDEGYRNIGVGMDKEKLRVPTSTT